MFNAVGIQSAKEKVSAYIDLGFTLKFIGLFCLFYYGNECFVRIVGPGKVYSAFLDHNLNYLTFLKYIILDVSKAFSQFLGMDTFMVDNTRLRVFGGPSVYLGLKCLGIGIMSFWLAFLIAQQDKWQNKLFWAITGMVVIFFLNCLRITLILFALSHNWKQFRSMDHHMAWNIATYVVIILLFIVYSRRNRRSVIASSEVRVTKIPA